MLYSMTGFGKSVVSDGEKKIVIEIKCLNSKQLDLGVKMPQAFREKEMDIRNMIKIGLERGKVDVNIYFDNGNGKEASSINREVVSDYCRQLADIAREMGCPVDTGKIATDILAISMRCPDVMFANHETVDASLWEVLKSGILSTMEEVKAFRVQEGLALTEDMRKRIALILEYESGLSVYEGSRVERVRARLEERLGEWREGLPVDENRLEQELIYYIEKFDITEERVRLKNHCAYFLRTAEEEDAAGRKLGFIAQEIGREINTIGSKANDGEMQRSVVMMKDELEKIKEQILNIL